MDNTNLRVMLSTVKEQKEETVVLRDELPALEENEIRLRVDKVGLSANNMFYLQMGEAPFLKFFSVYPLDDTHKHLANMPAWGVATVIETANPDFTVGERFRGFLHMTNVVQMKARRNEGGFVAYGKKRDKLNQAYNGFTQVIGDGASPIKGEGVKSDLAMTASPSAGSGFILFELLKMNDFYNANSIVLTSASSKFSLATALLVKEFNDSLSADDQGRKKTLVGYTGTANVDFVNSTNLYDTVIGYDEDLPAGNNVKHILIDIAGDGMIYKRNKENLVKALAVGGTHSDANVSVFTAFGASGMLKMLIDMMAPKWLQKWGGRNLHPTLEMFFAPTVINELLARWGKEKMQKLSDEALTKFVDAAIDNNWIEVDRSESIEDIQQAYKRILAGSVPPSQAVILSMTDV